MAKTDEKQLIKRIDIPTFKPLRPQEVQVRPFKVNKEYILTEADTGSVSVIYGTEDTGTLFNDTFETNSNGTYKKQIYDSVKHLYYEFEGEPINTFGITDTNRIYKQLHNELTLLTVFQSDFGEAIKERTVEIVNEGITILDDGDGNLYDSDESASFAVSKSEYTIGNVFYEHGNIILTDNGLFASQSISVQDFVTSSFQLTYKNIHTVYEWQICCTIEADEFNLTFNPSILSSSLSSSYGEELIESFVNGIGFEYDKTFTSSGRKIILAEMTASTFGGCVSNSIPVTESKTYFVDIEFNHISGSFPNVAFVTGQSGASTGKSNVELLVNGSNKFILNPDDTGEFYLQIQIGSGHGSFSTKEISVREVKPDALDISNNLRGEFVTGSEWAPYITTIGLYDDLHIEPLAIGKLARPIKNDRDIPINFVVRFDI